MSTNLFVPPQIGVLATQSFLVYSEDIRVCLCSEKVLLLSGFPSQWREETAPRTAPNLGSVDFPFQGREESNIPIYPLTFVDNRFNFSPSLEENVLYQIVK